MRRISTYIVLIALCFCPVVVVAQSAELREDLIKFAELITKGRYADAEPFAKRAVELGEKGRDLS